MADGNNTYPFDASDVANPHLGTHTQEQKEAIAVEWNTAHEAEEAERNHYATKRKAEYDQLNQFEMMFDDDRDGTSTWVDKINEIKGRHPK